MKLYTTVSPFGNIKDDLLYWIKFHISQKLFDIKQDEGYDVDVIEASQKLFRSNSIEVFNKEYLNIVKNGFSSINVYVNPLLNLYDFVSKEENLTQITDFNTEYRDKVFLGTIKDFKYNTKMIHFLRINDLFSFIEDFLSNTKDAEEYTFDIKREIVNYRIIYPFSKDKISKKVIEEDEIIHLLSAMDSFSYKGMSVAKAKLMIKIVLFSGLSSAELSNLKKESVKRIKNPHELLRGKYLEIQVTHTIPRTVYIDEQLIIEEYIQYELEYKVSPHSLNNDFYFSTMNGKRYTMASLHVQFENVIKYANIENESAVNSFLKYGYANYLYKNGVSIYIIFTLFGNKKEIWRHFEKWSPKIVREEKRKVAL